MIFTRMFALAARDLVNAGEMQFTITRQMVFTSKCSQVKRIRRHRRIFSERFEDVGCRLGDIIIHHFISNKSQRLLLAFRRPECALHLLSAIQRPQAAFVNIHTRDIWNFPRLCTLQFECHSKHHQPAIHMHDYVVFQFICAFIRSFYACSGNAFTHYSHTRSPCGSRWVCVCVCGEFRWR